MQVQVCLDPSPVGQLGWSIEIRIRWLSYRDAEPVLVASQSACSLHGGCLSLA